MEPDPKCRWCNGSGEILLLVRVVPCDCTRPTEKDDSESVRDAIEKSFSLDGM